LKRVLNLIQTLFKSYSNDQWQLYREQTWFNMTDILHALILNWNINDERILITMKNPSLKVSQITNDFSNI
jgi:hypothetical protein